MTLHSVLGGLIQSAEDCERKDWFPEEEAILPKTAT